MVLFVELPVESNVKQEQSNVMDVLNKLVLEVQPRRENERMVEH